MSKICGIDDAGKGPIIGPMIIAGVSLDVKDLHKLEKIGVKDSKKLTAKKREELYHQIMKIVDNHKIIIISIIYTDIQPVQSLSRLSAILQQTCSPVNLEINFAKVI